MKKRLHMSALLIALLLIGGTACGGDGDNADSGSDGMTVAISSPKDGSSVSAPFKLEVDASVELGSEDSGKHHVHLYFDDDDSKYEVVEAASWDVDKDSPAVAGLSSGEHTMNVSLRNADHSAAGAEAEVKVTVGEGGKEAPSTDSGNDDYGY